MSDTLIGLQILVLHEGKMLPIQGDLKITFKSRGYIIDYHFMINRDTDIPKLLNGINDAEYTDIVYSEETHPLPEDNFHPYARFKNNDVSISLDYPTEGYAFCAVTVISNDSEWHKIPKKEDVSVEVSTKDRRSILDKILCSE